jgi:hypothetical protein
LIEVVFILAALGIVWKIMDYFKKLEKKQVREIVEREIRSIEEANNSLDRDALVNRVRAPAGNSDRD